MVDSDSSTIPMSRKYSAILVCECVLRTVYRVVVTALCTPIDVCIQIYIYIFTATLEYKEKQNGHHGNKIET